MEKNWDVKSRQCVSSWVAPCPQLSSDISHSHCASSTTFSGCGSRRHFIVYETWKDFVFQLKGKFRTMPHKSHSYSIVKSRNIIGYISVITSLWLSDLLLILQKKFAKCQEIYLKKDFYKEFNFFDEYHWTKIYLKNNDTLNNGMKF